MKNKAKKLFALLFACVVICCCVTSVNALSIFTVGDYTYAELADDSFAALYSCSDTVENVVVEDRCMGKYVLSIYEYAFYQNDIIKLVDFSGARHLNYIDTRAFSESGLSGTVAFPSALRSIGMAAFQDCDSLQSVVCNSSLTAIPDQCFYECDSLERVDLGNNVSSIGKNAFADCVNLTDINISNDVTSIDDTAFKNCNKLVLHCDEGSYLHSYCLRNGINYVLNVQPITYVLGDANGDGHANINDVTTIQRYKADMETLEGINFHAADVNGDGNVTIEDATIIQRFFAEYDDITYLIGKVITQ